MAADAHLLERVTITSEIRDNAAPHDQETTNEKLTARLLQDQ
jgi:hypothetical protein